MECDNCGIRMGEQYKVKTFFREWTGVRIKSKGCIQSGETQFCSDKCETQFTSNKSTAQQDIKKLKTEINT